MSEENKLLRRNTIILTISALLIFMSLISLTILPFNLFMILPTALIIGSHIAISPIIKNILNSQLKSSDNNKLVPAENEQKKREKTQTNELSVDESIAISLSNKIQEVRIRIPILTQEEILKIFEEFFANQDLKEKGQFLGNVINNVAGIEASDRIYLNRHFNSLKRYKSKLSSTNNSQVTDTEFIPSGSETRDMSGGEFRMNIDKIPLIKF